jgi:hypothetical protein
MMGDKKTQERKPDILTNRMVPVLIHVGHTNKKPLPIITANTIIIGTLIGIAGHFLR